MFFLLSIISIALGSQLENQLNSREFQEIIEDFVEVHKVASKHSNLGILIAGIRNTINQRSKEYNEFINTFRNSCENARSKVSGFVKSLNSHISEYQNNVNDFKSDIKKAQKSALENSNNLKTTQKRLKSLKEEMTKLMVDYHAGAAASDEKIGVTKYLIDTIHDNLIEHSEGNHPVRKGVKKTGKKPANSHRQIKKAVSHKHHHSHGKKAQRHRRHHKNKKHSKKAFKRHRRHHKKVSRRHRRHHKKVSRKHPKNLTRREKRALRRLNRRNRRRQQRRHRKHNRKHNRKNKHKKGKKNRKVKNVSSKVVRRNTQGFIQLAGNFREALEKFQNTVLKSGVGSFGESAILGSLVELSTQGKHVDQPILLKILKLLDQLKKNLEKFRAQKEIDLKNTLKNYRNQESNLGSQINDYSHLGERYLSLIAEGHQNIQILESDIKDLKSEINRKQSELTSLTKLCENENTVFQKIEKSGKLLLHTLSVAANLALKI